MELMTAAEVAELFGVTKQTLWNWMQTWLEPGGLRKGPCPIRAVGQIVYLRQDVERTLKTQ